MTMFDIGTELENASVAMRRADDIWEIFLEDVEQDLEQMDDNDSWVQYMRKRFDRAKSLLEAAILQQGEALATLNKIIDTVYTMSREEKANRKQT